MDCLSSLFEKMEIGNVKYITTFNYSNIFTLNTNLQLIFVMIYV